MRQSLLAQKQAPPQTKQVVNLTGGTNLPNFQLINGRLISYDDNQNNYIVKGYNINDIVYSIVRLITDKARVAPWGVYKIEDEQAYKQLKSETSKKEINIRTVTALQSKAMKPVQNAGKWGELLKYPNDQETWHEQVGNGIAFKLLTGNRYRWFNMLKAGANAGSPNAIWLMPSQWMKIWVNNTFPARATGYTLDIIPGSNYLPEEILHDKYFNPNYDINGQQLYGMAPLKAGLMRLQKSNALIKSEASSMENEGIKGVLAMKNQIGNVSGEETVLEVGRLAETLRSEWQGPQNRGRIGLSGYELSWIPVGLNAEEMALIESGLMDLRMLCNLFGGVPTQLLNDPHNKTYNNQKEGEKALTSRCVLPELCAERDSLNRRAPEIGLAKGQVIDFDMTVYSELQADVKETAEWTSKLVALIPNLQLELCGLTAIADPKMDEPWILQGGSRVPISEMQPNDVDNALNDDDPEDI